MSCALLAYIVLDQLKLSLTPRAPGGPNALTVVGSPYVLAIAAAVVATMVFSVATMHPPEPNPFAPDFNPEALKLSALPDMLFRIARASCHGDAPRPMNSGQPSTPCGTPIPCGGSGSAPGCSR